MTRLKPLVTQHNGHVLTAWVPEATVLDVTAEAERRSLTRSAFLSRLITAGMASLKKAREAQGA